MDNLDDDGADMAEIEARLYASVHHDSSSTIEKVPQYNTAPVRLVSERSVINTNVSKQLGGRYWLQPTNNRPNHHPPKNSYNKNTPNRPNLNVNTNSKEGQPKFVPYQSFLSGMRTTTQNPAVPETTSDEQQSTSVPPAENPREKSPKKSAKKQPKQKFINPLNEKAISKMERLSKYQSKKEKAQSAKANSNNKKTPPRRKPSSETIILIDSSDDDEVEPGESKVKEVKEEEVVQREEDDADDDDVIEIPVPPPPLVTIEDSSDDQSSIMQSPAKKKKKSSKKKSKKTPEYQYLVSKPSSRCVSPSNSSILSDDFIGGNDRDLLKHLDSSQSLDAHDIELQNNEMTVEHLLRLRKMGKSPGAAKVLELTNRRPNRSARDGPFLHPTDKTQKQSVTPDSRAASVSGIHRQDPATPTTSKVTSNSDSDTESLNKSTDLTRNSNVIKDLLNNDDFISVEDTATPRSTSKKRKGSNKDIVDSVYERKLPPKKKQQATNEADSDGDSDSDGVMDIYDETDFNRVPRLVRSEDEETFASKRRKCKKFDVKTYYETDSFVTMLSNICQENFDTDEENDDNDDLSKKNRNDNDTAILDEINEIFDDSSEEYIEIDTPKDKEVELSSSENSNEAPMVIDGNQLATQADGGTDTILNTKYINPMAYRHEYFRGKKVVAPRETLVADEIDVGMRNDKEADPENSVVQREIGWNEEMKRFYYNSWGGEDFDVRSILISQTNNDKAWHINKRDRFPYTPANRHIRCRNCQEFGHIQSKCQAPIKKCVCHMCGENGHREPRCPNKICLRCGSPARVFGYGCIRCRNEEMMTCALCRIKGHSINYCPDKWRRYYSTIKDTNVVVNDVVYNSCKAWCSVCAGRGHRSNECHNSSKIWLQKLYRTEIQSHTPYYPKRFTNDDDTTNKKANKMAYAIFSMEENFTFNYDLNVTSDPDLMYNRFKRAVGLEAEEAAEEQAARRKRKKKSKVRLKICENVDDAETSAKSMLSEFSFSEEMRKLEEEQPDDKFELRFITDAAHIGDVRDNESALAELTIAVDVRTEERVVKTLTNPLSKADVACKSSRPSPPGHDEDSSYNFSEYFPKGEEAEEEITDKTGAVDKVEPEKTPLSSEVVAEDAADPQAEPEKDISMPDFIPLSADGGEDIQLTNVVVGSLELANVSSSTEAKIFLSKLHCKILLGLDGNRFLNTASTKHELMFRFIWQSFGNMLLITGSRDRQDQFHTELIEYLKEKEDETYSRQIEMSTRVPKQRLKLIRFLEDQIKSLERSSGNNLKACYSKLQFFEQSKNRTNSDRMRRQLNMILMGQIGMCDGKMHLAALKTNLTHLLKDKITDIVSEQFRNEVQEHYNYIFSPFNHRNYADLVEQCRQLKVVRTGPGTSTSALSEATAKLNSMTDNRTQSPVIELANIVVNAPAPPDQELQVKSKTPACTSATTESPKSALTKSDSNEVEDQSDVPKIGLSAFWSGKCTEIVEECRDILNSMKNSKGIAKLEMVSQKAQNEQLTFTDYSSLLKILSKIKSNNEK